MPLVPLIRWRLNLATTNFRVSLSSSRQHFEQSCALPALPGTLKVVLPKAALAPQAAAPRAGQQIAATICLLPQELASSSNLLAYSTPDTKNNNVKTPSAAKISNALSIELRSGKMESKIDKKGEKHVKRINTE